MADTDKKVVSIRDLFATDRSSEENGKWFDFGPDVSFKIRRFKSKHATRVRTELEKPFERTRVGGQIPQDIMEDIIHETLVKSIIVDWKGPGVINEAGEVVPYSQAACDAFLREYPEMRDEITAISVGMDNFRDDDDASTEKNSSTPSTTS